MYLVAQWVQLWEISSLFLRNVYKLCILNHKKITSVVLNALARMRAKFVIHESLI